MPRDLSVPPPRSAPVPIRRTGAALLSAVALGIAAACTPGDGATAPADARSILVSIDALNEAILRATLTPEEAPNLYRLFDEAMCADHAVSHFPSVTAASHATLWTGAYGDVHGVTSNTMPRIPRDAHTVLETLNGFHFSALAAEPLWITAGRMGVPVAGHHVTQAPGVPGYPAVTGARTPAQEARRAESGRVLARTDLNVLNGYNRILEGQRVLRGADVSWADDAQWEGLDALGSVLPPRTFRWTVNEVGTLHGALVALPDGDEPGDPGEGWNALLLSRDATVAGAVTARLRPPEPEPYDGVRSLARHFSEPLEAPVEGGRVWIPVRLFDVAPDGSDFMLYLPPIQVVEGSRDEFTEAYERAIGGWTGNSGYLAYRAGAFGPRLADGGEGTAEARYLETAEHLLRQFADGSEWLWRTHRPRVLMDYFPLSDAIDHELLGWMDPARPGFDAELAERIRAFRAQVWGLVDRRLGHLMALASEEGAALFVSGDHGMRASWNAFHVNLALRDAGLLALDEDGAIDLSRTRIASPNGYFLKVNRVESPEGIVPPEEVAEVLDAAIEALLAVRTPEGERVVTRVFVPARHPEMGIGGPAGGDLYWGTSPGIRSVGSVRADGALVESFLTAGHGFPPDEPDMYTVFCAWGDGFEAGRIPSVRTTVVAPTVAEHAGLPAPRDAVGRSVLADLRRGGDPLAERLRARIAEEGDSVHVAVALHDIESARRLEIDADRVFHAASTMKVPILYELFRRHDDGELDVDAPFPVRNTFRSVFDGSPFTLETDADDGLLEALGSTLPARRVAHGMITRSSNLGTNLLLEALTPAAVQARMDRLGAGGMQVRRGVSDIPAFEAGFSNETTARGLLRVMEIVARCEELSPSACADMHRILEEQEFRSEIPAGLPQGTRVGNKTGSITRIRHDAAIVHPEGRAPFVLVVLTEGFLDGDHASAVIADLARIAWEGVTGGA
jgi:beta-lactamase class A/predicted AlkP superfamily phosphohydrolase/phosphomutase